MTALIGIVEPIPEKGYRCCCTEDEKRGRLTVRGVLLRMPGTPLTGELMPPFAIPGIHSGNAGKPATASPLPGKQDRPVRPGRSIRIAGKRRDFASKQTLDVR